MKSEHRHELKTNELAEWIGNFPEWVRENSISIIVVIALIIVIGGFFVWWHHNKYVVQPQEEVALTNLLGEIPQIERQIVTKQNQGTDVSHYLLPLADQLKSFAETERNKNMSALALIQHADALRVELHYRLGTISPQDLAEQIGRAKASYTEAITKASSNPSFVAAAKFGLGLCAEELSDFNEARKIYQEIASNSDFEGTVTAAQAKNRLDVMNDYESEVVFKPAPKIEPKVSTAPKMEIKPLDSNLPADVNLQLDVNLPADMNERPEANLPANTVPADINLIPEIPDTAAQVPDINSTTIPPDSVPEDSDVNVPVE